MKHSRGDDWGRRTSYMCGFIACRIGAEHQPQTRVLGFHGDCRDRTTLICPSSASPPFPSPPRSLQHSPRLTGIRRCPSSAVYSKRPSSALLQPRTTARDPFLPWTETNRRSRLCHLRTLPATFRYPRDRTRDHPSYPVVQRLSALPHQVQ